MTSKANHPQVITKKYLGQNFLVDPRAIERIVAACDFSLDEMILEIGPGEGALTSAILPFVKGVVAVEADRVLAESLAKNYEGESLTVCHADFLKFDLRSLTPPLKIVGNIPYNISTPILTKIIDDRRLISSVFMTIQYEFGERIVARAGSKDYSSLSCLMQMFTEPRILFKIAPQSFRPVPKVTSCLLRIDVRKTPAEALDDELIFMRIVRLAFSQRRKNLLNALSSLYPSKKEKLVLLLEKAGVKITARAEELSISQYARMANAYSQNLLS